MTTPATSKIAELIASNQEDMLEEADLKALCRAIA